MSTSSSPSLVLEEGALLAQKYRLARTAGFGGMAQLWVATNELTGAEICIKILVPEKDDEDAVERFRREARAAARLTHRAIVRVFDLLELGPDGDQTTVDKPAALAIVMELLRGETLADFIMKKGKLPLEEAIDIALPFLAALAHAHRAGVVHRDVKPDNIFLAADPDGHVVPKVLDFGVSKVTSAKQLTIEGVMLGTPSYMSPEQARGARDVDARSDVFSAGIVLYMMLAGKNPFENESFHSVVTAILEHTPPPLPGVPDEIWAVIEQALSKDAKDRYADATGLGIALRRASGRTSTTDSGAQMVALPVESVHNLKVPLGGNSHVTVPPVENPEPQRDEDLREPRARIGDGSAAARQRAVRIVMAVVGAAVLLLIVALLRGPTNDSSPPSSAMSRIAPPTATAQATVTAAPATAAVDVPPPEPVSEPAASASAPPADTAEPPPVVTAATPATQAPAPTQAPAVPTAVATTFMAEPADAGAKPQTLGEKKREIAVPPAEPGTRPRGGAPAPTFKEPSIVRDPGF